MNKEFHDKLALGISEEEREILDEGSNHEYSCRCETCRKWWKAMGPEVWDDDDPSFEPSYGPFTKEEVEAP